jgi:hypothetical protein
MPVRDGQAAVDDAMAMARRYGEDPADYQGPGARQLPDPTTGRLRLRLSSAPLRPRFAARDQGRWEGGLLHSRDFVVCADDEPSIQARARIHGTLPTASSSRGQRVEHI